MAALLSGPGSDDERPVVIIGGGMAGLFTALKLAPLPVTVVTPRPLGEGASSAWAQAGIAAAIAEGDSFEQHAADTIRAGAGLCDSMMVEKIVREAPARVEDLLRFGVPFDRDLEGRLRQSREAAHSQRRVIGVQGDRAGKAIMAALIASAQATPSISVMEAVNAVDLAVSDADGRITGLYCASVEGGTGRSVFLPARAVVLATGGIGQLYTLTTNPPEARGDGIAMAARAGGVIADAEFVQFHPTALDVGLHPAPLATEALRGDGATLVNNAGDRFMSALHEDAELAPRDVVARAVQTERAAGRGAFLDCRGKLGAEMPERFPTVYAACQAAGIDPATDLFRSLRLRIIIWAAWRRTRTLARPSPVSGPLARRPRPVFTVRTGSRRIRCWKLSSWRRGQQRIFPELRSRAGAHRLRGQPIRHRSMPSALPHWKRL